MNKKYVRVPARFGPDTRFEVRPSPPAPFRAVHENRFEQLKAGLVARRLDTLWKPELNVEVRRAANEAAALAWITPYPLLVFPLLFEERANEALARTRRQRQIRQNSYQLYAV